MPVLPFVSPELDIPERVAVVGSSPNIIGRGLGKEIDGYDWVIRLNRCPVKGYEKDVGRRSPLRVVNGGIFRDFHRGGNTLGTTILPEIQKIHNGRVLVIDNGNARKLHADKGSTKLGSSKKVFYLEDRVRAIRMGCTLMGEQFPFHNAPTLGTVAMMLLMNAGITPHLYAWSLDGSRGHYWESRKREPTTNHNVSGEHKMWKRLAEAGKIVIH